jgi:hypothetical protein
MGSIVRPDTEPFWPFGLFHPFGDFPLQIVDFTGEFHCLVNHDTELLLNVMNKGSFSDEFLFLLLQLLHMQIA